MRNPYEVLGVDKDCPQGEITKAFRRLAQTLHPDKPTGDEEEFQELQAAYDKIGTVEARKDFDEGKTPLSPDDVRSTLMRSMRSALAENPMQQVLPRLYAFLESELFKNQAAILRFEGQLKRLRANQTRMSVEGDRPNLFLQAVTAEIQDREVGLQGIRDVVAMLNAMKDELKFYKEGSVVYPYEAPAAGTKYRLFLE